MLGTINLIELKMKTKFLFFCLLCFNFAFAGTPSVNGTAILYGIPLLLLVGLLGVPYLIKYIKARKASKLENREEPAIDDSDTNV